MVFRRKKDEGRPADDTAQASTAAASQGPEAVLMDELGLYHLWYLERRLQEELARAGRTSRIFSLACWRTRLLPGESLNDGQVRKAAELIAKRLRSYDVFARIDEERFVALVLDAEYQAASTVAFRIKGDMQIQIQSSGRWQAGVSAFPRDGMEGNALIQTAFRRIDDDGKAA